MTINITVLREDFITVVRSLGSVENNDHFRHLQTVAHEMQLPLVATIDEQGCTVMNYLQLELLAHEVQKLRERPDVNQGIVDKLQEVVDTTNICRHHQYIKFAGT